MNVSRRIPLTLLTLALAGCGTDADADWPLAAGAHDAAELSPRLAPAFGSCVPNPYHDISGSVDLVAEAQFGWVRLSAFWDQIEASPEAFDFSILDGQVAEAEAAGVEVFIQVHPFFPAWVTGQEEPRSCWGAFECSTLPEDRAAFRAALRRFVGVLIDRYAASVDFWEVWSEPDGRWFFNGTAAEFVENILVPVAETVRARDPSAAVVGPGLWNSNPFLRQTLQAACHELDVISVHTYDGNTVESRLARLERFEATIAEHCPQKPIWISEFGFRSADVGEAEQGGLLVGVMQGALEIPGVEKVFQYSMRETTGVDGTGLVVQDHRTSQVVRYKPAFYEVQEFLRTQLPRVRPGGGARLTPDSQANTEAESSENASAAE